MARKGKDRVTNGAPAESSATEPGDETQRGRRRLLQILLGTGAIASGKLLPDEWIKPVVDIVALPAHAQTSPDTGGDDPTPDDDDDDDDIFDDDDDDDLEEPAGP